MRSAPSTSEIFTNERDNSQSLAASFTAWGKPTDIRAELTLRSDSNSSVIQLAFDEVSRLRECLIAISKNIRSRSTTSSSVTFADEEDDGRSFTVTDTNFGDPFEEGVRFNLEFGPDSQDGISVDLTAYGLVRLAGFLDVLLAKMDNCALSTPTAQTP